MNKENKLILYKDESGKVSLNVRFADEDVWLTWLPRTVAYSSEIPQMGHTET